MNASLCCSANARPTHRRIVQPVTVPRTRPSFFFFPFLTSARVSARAAPQPQPRAAQANLAPRGTTPYRRTARQGPRGAPLARAPVAVAAPTVAAASPAGLTSQLGENGVQVRRLAVHVGRCVERLVQQARRESVRSGESKEASPAPIVRVRRSLAHQLWRRACPGLGEAPDEVRTLVCPPSADLYAEHDQSAALS